MTLGLTYQDIEKAIVSIIDEASLVKLPEQYGGQFSSAFTLPEDYDARVSPYIFVQVMQDLRDQQKSNDWGAPNTNGLVIVYVGAKASTALQAKNQVYDLIPKVRSLIHGKRISNGCSGSEIAANDESYVDLVWERNYMEFTVPNHVCWTVTFKMTSLLSINI